MADDTARRAFPPAQRALNAEDAPALLGPPIRCVYCPHPPHEKMCTELRLFANLDLKTAIEASCFCARGMADGADGTWR